MKTSKNDRGKPSGSGRARHPLISTFLAEGRRLSDVIREIPEPRDPVLQLVVDLDDATSSADNAKLARVSQLAGQLDLKDVDPCLAAYLLVGWSRVSAGLNRLEEAELLFRRAQLLVDDHAPREIRAMLLSHEAWLVGVIHGDNRRRLELGAEVVKIVGRKSPHYPRAFHAYAMQLGRAGMLDEFEDELRCLKFPAGSAENAQRAYTLLAGRAETGRLDGIEPLLAAARSEAGDRYRNIILAAGHYAVLIDLMRGRWKPPGGQWPGLEEAERDQDEVLWAMSMQMLLDHRPEDALRWARATARVSWQMDNWDNFRNHTLVRAEVAAGNSEAARRMLLARQSRGNWRYLDDLFMARVELLAGNTPAAARHFSVVRAACERYKAEGRLEFELRMACEMNPGDLFRLMRLPAAPAPAAPGGPLPQTHHAEGLRRLVGASPALEDVRKTIRSFAPIDTPVLIIGETGTGKELVARALHEESPRAGQPFVAVNCGAITESLLESELFGHESGAFTGAGRAHHGLFEAAGRGTLLLDEIGDISARLQVALLRVLETGEVRPVGAPVSRKAHCRVLAATNADLVRLVDEGRFRRDLYFRLNRLAIRLPPLRERREDIPALADHFLSEDRHDGHRPVMSENLKAALLARQWPGNVRELRNAIERMRLLNSDKLSYDAPDLEVETAASPASAAGHEDGVFGKAAAPADAGRTSAPAADVLSGRRSTLRRRDALRELFRRYQRLNVGDIVQALKVSVPTARMDLRALCAEGLAEKVEPNRSPRTHHFRIVPDSKD